MAGPAPSRRRPRHEQRGHESDLGARTARARGRCPRPGRRRPSRRRCPCDPRAPSRERGLPPTPAGRSARTRPGRAAAAGAATAWRPVPRASNLDQPLALAGATGVDAVVKGGLPSVERAGRAKASDRPHRRPETHAVPVEDRRSAGSTTDVDADPPRDGPLLSARLLDPLDVERRAAPDPGRPRDHRARSLEAPPVPPRCHAHRRRPAAERAS